MTDSVPVLLEPSVQVTVSVLLPNASGTLLPEVDVAARGDAGVVGRGVGERRGAVGRRSRRSALVIVTTRRDVVEARRQ